MSDGQDKPHGFGAFRYVPKTGVIYVMSKANARGYTPGAPDWANLGQGMPETGGLPGSPARLETISITEGSMEYGHVVGIPDLRKAVAELYNHRFRRGMASQYGIENVAISPGGRSALVRIATSLKHINIGHCVPDYTAYAELLDTYRALIPIPILLDKANSYKMSPELLRNAVSRMGLGAVLLSNPGNPTGQILHGEALSNSIDLMRELKSALIFDEFYSHYHYESVSEQPALSAAAYIEDVNKDAVVIVDGLSKNWRYPGLRVSWTLGPADVIQAIAASGSFLDGGASHPVQKAILPLLEPSLADAEARAIQAHFGEKRKIVLKRLQKMGFVLGAIPEGSFYVFLSLENMPAGLRSGQDFFKEALERKVICIPGVFFDVDPGHRRSHIPSPLSNYIRISYGPKLAEVNRGLDKLALMISDFS